MASIRRRSGVDLIDIRPRLSRHLCDHLGGVDLISRLGTHARQGCVHATGAGIVSRERKALIATVPPDHGTVIVAPDTVTLLRAVILSRSNAETWRSDGCGQDLHFALRALGRGDERAILVEILPATLRHGDGIIGQAA